MSQPINVARANHDIASSALNRHQLGCEGSCTISHQNIPPCKEGARLTEAWATSADELRYAERQEAINAGH